MPGSVANATIREMCHVPEHLRRSTTRMARKMTGDMTNLLDPSNRAHAT
jgi:hypothetical protein